MKRNIKLPVVLFIDGHASHASLPLSQFCTEKGIELVALYPNATHILQPMDVAVFHTLKMSWKQKVQEWRLETGDLNKHDFARVLKVVLERITPQILRNGFQKCGLFPWNPEIVVVPQFEAAIKETEGVQTKKASQLEKHVVWFEAQIGIDKLKTFQENNGAWTGSIEDSSLYNLWKKVKALQQNTTTSIDMNALELQPQAEPPRSLTPQPVQQVAPSPIVSQPVQQVAPPIASQPVQPVSPTPVTLQPVESPSQPEVEITSNSLHFKDKAPETPVASTSKDFVPSPFKRALFWPSPAERKTPKRKRERIPAVITSPQALEYLKKKEVNKKKLEKEKEERKKAREEKKIVQEKKKKQQESVAKKGKRQRDISESESSDESAISLMNSSDSEWHEEDSDEMMIESLEEKSLKEGNFIICEFVGGKRSATKFTYLCIVQEIIDDVIKVMGLKSVNAGKTEFVADENDISFISFNQIIGYVKSPELTVRGERIRYVFKKRLNVKEK